MSTQQPKKLPIGVQAFSEIREGDYLYVDKTEVIHRLITHNKYFFLSRPRRFGKSLTLSTLQSLYSGEKALFKGLWIENHWDWAKKNPVIYISFSEIGYTDIGLETALLAEIQVLSQKNNIILTEKNSIGRLFRELIEKLYQKHGKVVLLIDEYDKPIIDYLTNIDKAKENQKLLKSFYSVLKDADIYLEFMLITGISKFSKVSIFSDLNNVIDMSRHYRYSTLVGYTQEEIEYYFKDRLEELAEKHQQDYAVFMQKVKTWYNGYTWDLKYKLYNPFSFMSFLDAGEFGNFWFETGTPTFLLDLMKQQHKIEIDPLEMNELAFASYDIERLSVLPILFQTGYITLKSKDEFGLYQLGYPNQEVKAAMLMYLIGEMRHTEPSLSTAVVIYLHKAFLANDIEEVIYLIKSIFATIPSSIFIHDAEAYYHSLIYLVFFYLGIYSESEVNTHRGRLDCVVKTATHIYIIEFKLNRSADAALKQIKDRAYYEKYQADRREIVLLGINFSLCTRQFFK